MTSENIQKLKRLIAFRERQRDLAAAEMESARREEEDARLHRLNAENELETELNIYRNSMGNGFLPEDLELAARGAQWAHGALREKEELLAQKTQETNAQRMKLLESHKKVQQMESLHNKRKKEFDRGRSISEQSELDDLASVREVHR